MEKRIIINGAWYDCHQNSTFKLINLFIENKLFLKIIKSKLFFNQDKLIHIFVHRINQFKYHIRYISFRKISFQATSAQNKIEKFENDLFERTSDFPSSIAITVFVVKTVAWRSTNTIASRRDGKLQNSSRLQTRGILWRFFSEWHSIFRLVTSRVPPTARTVCAI